MPAQPKHIIVIGAGVTGLQTALSLIEAGYRVTIVAQHLPGDYSSEYASPWAGAQWRTHASADDEEQCRWDAETYESWMEIVEREEKEGLDPAQRSGLKLFACLHYWESKTPEIANGASSLWWRHAVRDFNVIRPANLPPRVHLGVSFTTFAINVPRYLTYLLRKVEALGGALIRATLPTAGGLVGALDAASAVVTSRVDGEERPYAFVNATGLGARQLVGDESMYPTRGQTVLVRGEAKKLRARTGEGSIAYCIVRPGSGTTILGGTREDGAWDCKPDSKVTRRILGQTRELCPELLNEKGEFDVVSVQVGLRPSRRGGTRVEKETVTAQNGLRRLVVHAYGHAGAGYQNSVGSSKKIVRLLAENGEDLQAKAKM